MFWTNCKQAYAQRKNTPITLLGFAMVWKTLAADVAKECKSHYGQGLENDQEDWVQGHSWLRI